MPLLLPSGAPIPPEARAGDSGLRTEPIYIRAMGIESVVDSSNRLRSRGEEYIVFFYVGQIAADAVSSCLYVHVELGFTFHAGPRRRHRNGG